MSLKVSNRYTLSMFSSSLQMHSMLETNVMHAFEHEISKAFRSRVIRNRHT